jgi:hypothetical protein
VQFGAHITNAVRILEGVEVGWRGSRLGGKWLSFQKPLAWMTWGHTLAEVLVSSWVNGRKQQCLQDVVDLVLTIGLFPSVISWILLYYSRASRKYRRCKLFFFFKW